MSELEKILEQNPYVFPALAKRWEEGVKFCWDKGWRPIEKRYKGFRFVSGDYINYSAEDRVGCVCLGDEKCRDCDIWDWVCEEVTFGLLGGE